jgi:hypothetical protein
MEQQHRYLYLVLLTDWLGATKPESAIVLGDEFDSLPIFKEGCSAALSTKNFIQDKLKINVYPNPAIDTINIQFSGNNELVKITLYNTIGAVIKEITNKKYSTTQHTLSIHIKNLPQGNYFVLYQTKGVSKTKKILKY